MGQRVESVNELIGDKAKIGGYCQVATTTGPVWFALDPGGNLANLSAHEVTEHEDGTITVSPSILTNRGRDNEWHGWLERGVWRDA